MHPCHISQFVFSGDTVSCLYDCFPSSPLPSLPPIAFPLLPFPFFRMRSSLYISSITSQHWWTRHLHSLELLGTHTGMSVYGTVCPCVLHAHVLVQAKFQVQVQVRACCWAEFNLIIALTQLE